VTEIQIMEAKLYGRYAHVSTDFFGAQFEFKKLMVGSVRILEVDFKF
jgi:hypothetical protein